MNQSTKILKLDFNERCDGSPDWVSKKLKQFSDTPLWKYPDKTELQNSIANFYQLEPENVLATNGADEAIQLILLSCKFNLLDINKVILPTPTFSMYQKGLEQWQLKYELIKSNSDQTQSQQQIKQQFENSKKSLLILVRPNNPTGEMLQKEFILELLIIAKNNNNLVLVDEAYSDFADDNCEAVIANSSSSSNLMILKTFSKAYGLAALRVGYLLASKSIVEAVESIAMPFNLSSLSLLLANQCFSVEAQTEVKSYREKIKQNREQLIDYLECKGYQVIHSSGNFIFLSLTQKKCLMLKTLCVQNNICIRGFNEDSLINSVRITIPLELDTLISVFNQLQKPELFCLDMDGTLIDVSSSYDKAIAETVKFFSEINISIEDINRLRIAGGFNNDWVLSKELLQQRDIDIPLQQVTDKFQEYYLGTKSTAGLIDNESSLMDAATQSFFQDSKIIIVTGRPRPEAELATKQLNFDCPIISMDDVVDPKPHPESVLKALQLSHTKSAWMIGDNIDDIYAAVSAGIIAIGIGIEKQQQFYDAGAAVVLENINQIQQLI